MKSSIAFGLCITCLICNWNLHAQNVLLCTDINYSFLTVIVSDLLGGRNTYTPETLYTKLYVLIPDIGIIDGNDASNYMLNNLGVKSLLIVVGHQYHLLCADPVSINDLRILLRKVSMDSRYESRLMA